MNDIIDIEQLDQYYLKSLEWFTANILSLDALIQAVLLAILIPAALLVGKRITNFLSLKSEKILDGKNILARILNDVYRVLPKVTVSFVLWLALINLNRFEISSFFIDFVNTLLLAWIAINLATSILLLDDFWERIVTISAWSIAVLHIVELLQPTLDLLSSIGITLGTVDLNALSLIKACFVLLILMKFGMRAGDFIENRLSNVSDLPPSTQVLIGKIIRISIFFFIFVATLNSVGINLTTFAIFSGAIGVGIGFGLQKVIANLISGIILLMDKSIKPNDVIQIGDIYGWITSLRARYVSIITRDGTEYLIPNEDLITQQVINWSFTHNKIRIKVPVGISYNNDPHYAIRLMLEAANDVDRVLSHPAPVCLLTGFGDNSVDLELRVWMNDPQNGVSNLKSQILLNVWDKFKQHNIEIPFPQRDVHLDISSVDLQKLAGNG